MYSRRQPLRHLAPGVLLCGLGLGCAPTQAAFLELYTTDPTSFTQTPGGSATVTYTGRMTGLGSDVIRGFDIGLAYNPAFLTLQSFAFDSQNLLGDPSVNDGFFPTEVYQIDYLDNTNDPLDNPGSTPVNSTWDYRDNSNVNNLAPTGQTFTPPSGGNLGTPCPPPGDACSTEYSINQGSLRITALSLLELSELQNRQNTPNNHVTPLFEVTFRVDLRNEGRTPVDIVYSLDYTPQDGNALDLKYNDDFSTAQYPTRVNGEVVVAAVPIPGPLFLMLPGLAFVALRRRA